MSIDEKAFTKALEVWERKAMEGIQRGHILNAEEEGRIIIEAYMRHRDARWHDDELVKQILEENTRCIQANSTKRESLSQWQPIETAPKDGSALLLFDAHGEGMHKGYWSRDFSEWRTNRIDGRGESCPTHWMPLPTPPKGNEIEGDKA